LRELANEAPKLSRGVHITNLGSMRGVPPPLSARGIQPPRSTHGIPANSFDTAEHAITAANAPAGTSLAELDEMLAKLEVARSPEEILAVRPAFSVLILLVP
jgi:siderophore synthetase component